MEERRSLDAIPPKEVKDILHKMQTLMRVGIRGDNIANRVRHTNLTNMLFIDQILAIHTLYIIADNLAQKCKVVKARGICFSFVPFLIEYYPSNFTAIPIGADHRQYAKISHISKRVKKRLKGKLSFQ